MLTILERGRKGSDFDDARSIARTLREMVSIDEWVPVFSSDGRRILGTARGDLERRGVWFTRQWCGFADYATLETAFRNGQFARSNFTRADNASSSTVPWVDTWPCAPGGGAGGDFSGTALTARQFDDTTPGAILHGGNVSPATKHLIACGIQGVSTYSALGGPFLLYDRVLGYDQCTITLNSSQNFVNTLPALRYIAAGQQGLRVICPAGSALGATGSQMTAMHYTNQDGNAATVPQVRALWATFSNPGPSTSAASYIMVPWNSGGSIPEGLFIPLGAGDAGIRSLTDYTFSVANTGTITWALVKPIAWIPHLSVSSRQIIDCVKGRMAPYRIYDGACLSVIHRAPATGGSCSGEIVVAWN